ncbi:MAG TPA: DNA polymerase III subunit delta [Coxiellaceae bacterium]|nr:DNA polymerase III subunit delta [Coxiellaceae bacterium]
MQLKPHQLEAQLKNSLLPIYLLSGEEHLLKQEARDTIVSKAQTLEFTGRERIHVEGRFNWDSLNTINTHQDLFSAKKIIEIINPDAKFDAQAAKILSEYCAQTSDANLVIIISGKLNASQIRSQWYKAIEQQGACITFWPFNQQELLTWIRQRCTQINLKIDTQAIKLLAELGENNCLAIQQAIEKLKLLYPQQAEINADHVLNAISDQSRYTVFDLINYVLQGDTQRLLHVLSVLEQQGSEATLVLWALAKEVRTLLEIVEHREQGKNFQSLIEREIFTKRNYMQSAVRRLSGPLLKKLLIELTNLDQVIKGAKTGNIWLELNRFSLALAGKPL